MTKKINNIIIVLSVIILNFGVDKITKILAINNLQYKGRFDYLGGLVRLVYAENDGAFLGLGSNLPQPWKTFVLVLFPVIAIVAGIVYLFIGKHVSFKQEMAIACIIGGGIGNVYDRIMNLGAVTDFLNFGIGENFWSRTGVLNVADLSITFGAIFLFIFQYQEEKKLKNDETISENS